MDALIRNNHQQPQLPRQLPQSHSSPTSGLHQVVRSNSGKSSVEEWEYSDEFYCYHFKVVSCTKRYAHCWTTCPYAHPQEKARRRDPKAYPYCAVVCSALKHAGFCAKGDVCPYAHNVFEYWLHPSRFRTELCKDGAHCSRRVCFFAHSLTELRAPECLKSRIAESRSASGNSHLESLQYLRQLLVDIVNNKPVNCKFDKPSLLKDLSCKMKQYKVKHPVEIQEIESSAVETDPCFELAAAIKSGSNFEDVPHANMLIDAVRASSSTSMSEYSLSSNDSSVYSANGPAQMVLHNLPPSKPVQQCRYLSPSNQEANVNVKTNSFAAISSYLPQVNHNDNTNNCNVYTQNGEDTQFNEFLPAIHPGSFLATAGVY